MQRTALVSLCGVLAALVVGCGGDQGASSKGPSGGQSAATGALKVLTVPESTPLKLAFVTNNSSDFWNIAEAGVRKAEKEAGIAVDVKKPQNGTVTEQKRILEDLVSQGYHGVAISVIAASDQALDINRATETLNIITQDSDSPTSQRLAYVGTNNFEAGKALGQQIRKLLPEGGTMAVFVGTFTADNARERLRGIESAIEGAGIEIIAKKEDNKNETRARTNVEDVLASFPDVKLLAGLWAYNGPAIVAAMRESPKRGQVKVVCFDEDAATLQGIEEGIVECTVVQKPFEFGYRSSLLLKDLCRKGAAAIPKDGIVDTGVEVIDKSNVTAFSEQLKKLRSGQ